ncbi:MAG: transposase, partial [Bdellovibrionales bacterium]|nr:transposase [Bdellovibrionales bacterium]
QEPIDDIEEALKVIDIYRRRWVIEEYFKALKTGCQIERRLFSTLNSWYKMIALYLPIANTLLNLRHMDDSEYVANENRQVLSHTQI